MKVLRVIPTMNPISGGPCQGIRNSIPELKKLGINTEVVCLDDNNASFLENESFVIHALGFSKGPWQYNKNLKKWLRANISKYDCIIIHALWLYHGFAVYKIINEIENSGKDRTKYFVMPHGMLDPYFQKAETRKFKAIRNVIYWKLIEARIINGASGVLFTCEEEMNLAKTTFHPYHPKLELNVGYGIAPAPLKEYLNLNNEQEPQPYFLFLSRIHPKKGIELLIDGYVEIVHENINCDLPNLVIAGPGLETTYGKKLFDSIQQNLLIKNKIIFPGMLNGNKKWETIYNCEAFILPSHQENFGIAVAEALSCGKAVLISDKVNIWREIQAENAGIVESDSKEGVKKLLNKWISLSNDEKKRMGESAYNCFTSKFTIEKAAAKMHSTITNIINTK